MKRYLLLPLLLFWTVTASAGGIQYQMRVDGLACPYCAYGVEKKLKKVAGVEKIDVDLNQGLVTVDTKEEVELTDEQMTKLFQEAGFTFRSMTKREL